MYYQAIVDLKTDQIIGAESLVMWNHPQKGILCPSTFLSYIDDSSMVVEFGKMIIKKVFSNFETINNAVKKFKFEYSSKTFF